jgi:hypothetical protein
MFVDVNGDKVPCTLRLITALQESDRSTQTSFALIPRKHHHYPMNMTLDND